MDWHILRGIRRWLESWRRWPFRHISRAMYWLRSHTLDRYHVLNIRNKRNGYAWGWLDRSEGILFANMAILVGFIEEEKAFDCHVDWRSAAEMVAAGEKTDGGRNANYDAHAVAKKEMLEIYRWWTHERKIEHDRHDVLSSRAFPHPFEFERTEDGMYRGKEPPPTEAELELRAQYSSMEGVLEARDEEMMIRLIKVRGYMWT
jgi:hypothetical protein